MLSKGFRKHFSAPGLISAVCHTFSKIPDPREFKKNNTITLVDHLMSGLAIFGLKCPSLLDYDRKRTDIATKHNLKTLYHVNNPPSDSYLAERLDEVDPRFLRSAFTKVFAFVQRGKALKE